MFKTPGLSDELHVFFYFFLPFLFGFLLDLPVLQSAPRADRVTASTVTISWSAWDEETEAGDPPILGYTPYHKMASGQNWVSGLFTSTMSLNYTFKSLFPGNSYSFSVAAVREGDRGEGARSPELNVTTICEGMIMIKHRILLNICLSCPFIVSHISQQACEKGVIKLHF